MNEPIKESADEPIVKPSDFVYLGFGQRLMASVIDSIIQTIILIPIVIVYFPNLLNVHPQSPEFQSMIMAIQNVFLVLLAIYLLPFWHVSQSTIGKMAFHSKVLDAATGKKPTTKQFMIRFVGYIVSSLFLGLGFVWVLFDKRNQGLHDKMANTVVVKLTPANSLSA